MPNRHIDITVKAQAFTMVEFGGLSLHKVSDILKISRSTIKVYCDRARELGFDRETNPVVQDTYFQAEP